MRSCEEIGGSHDQSETNTKRSKKELKGCPERKRKLREHVRERERKREGPRLFTAVWKAQNMVWLVGSCWAWGPSRNGVVCSWHIWDAWEDSSTGSGHLRGVAACPTAPHLNCQSSPFFPLHSLVFLGLHSPVGLCEVERKQKTLLFFSSSSCFSSSPLSE